MSFAELSNKMRDRFTLLESAQGDKGKELAERGFAQAKKDFLVSLLGYKRRLEEEPAFGSIVTSDGKRHTGFLREISIAGEIVFVKTSKPRHRDDVHFLETNQITFSLNPSSDSFIRDISIPKVVLSKYMSELVEKERLESQLK